MSRFNLGVCRSTTVATTENYGSSDWDLPLSSLLPPSALGKRRRLNLFGKLIDDLVVEILIRLPNPRSSCRCKAVCKRWRSLISDPSFNRRIISHHRSRYRPAALFVPAHDPLSILSFLPVPDGARPRLRAFDCFKDLILCGFENLGRSYLVCNPFTKQWIALPLAPRNPENGYDRYTVVLACQPRCTHSSSSSSNYSLVQQLGDEPEPEPAAAAAFIYSEYRFRVVRHLSSGTNVIQDVFCSESGEWKRILMRNSSLRPWTNAVWWNGLLFWMDLDPSSLHSQLIADDPFRLDILTTKALPVPSALWNLLCDGSGNISVSQGALHIVLLQVEGVRNGLRNALCVWRLEKDDDERYLWRKIYEMALKRTSSLCGQFELENCFVLDLHPEKSEIVYFRYLEDRIFSFNLRTGKGKPEFFSGVTLICSQPTWRALQPRVSCWPTPIPRYENLRGAYNGSYDCWVQKSTMTTPPSTIGNNYFEFYLSP
ncbi:unnamed protein product [Linum tenue]|uniref:F-box domain-containing protein n=1 Tax=Linum tenue TaxID=586396 RepID=A0AAV0PER5_9ROSI|nr:unnamed protein product [Linum tenue]